jgi:hypothetical protein
MAATDRNIVLWVEARHAFELAPGQPVLADDDTISALTVRPDGTLLVALIRKQAIRHPWWH